MQNELKIIKLFKLEKYFKDLLMLNQANNAPYHNYYHTTTVMKGCYFIGQSLNLKFDELRMLCIAAMFHDFNHSQGKLKDNENVAIAIESFKKLSSETEDTSNNIIDIISATEYPYVIEEADLNLFQKIIRDADMLQCFEPNYIQQCVFGLMTTELKVPLEKAINGQLAFFKSLNFHTEYGKQKHEKMIGSCLEDLEFIQGVLTK